MDRLLNVMTVLSAALMLTILFAVRRSHIRVEYSVSWLTATFVLLVLSRSRPLLSWVTNILGIGDSPLTLIMVVFAVFLVVFYRFSMIISNLKDANIALTQRLAIVEFQLQNGHERH